MSNFTTETHYVPSQAEGQRTPYYFHGQRPSIEKPVSRHLGPVAMHWFAEVANSDEGEAVLETNATVAFDRRFQEDHDALLTKVFEAERDNPDRIAAFLAKLRERSLEGDLPPDGPVEYDVRQPEPDVEAAIQQIEQGER